jgi:hypothetical protein
MNLLHRHCRRRGWKLRAVVLEPVAGERIVQLQVTTLRHVFAAPAALSLPDQASYLGRQLWTVEGRG